MRWKTVPSNSLPTYLLILFYSDDERLRTLEPQAGLATKDPCSYWQLRRVARLPQAAVPGYHELDVRLAWQAGPGVELALAGRNLLLARHPEFGAAGMRQLAERPVFASATLRF